MTSLLALVAALERDALEPSFERWQVVLPPRSQWPTSASEWDGAVVLVESGAVELGCDSGDRRTFMAGHVLALGWLNVTSLGNPGSEPVRLLAVRRRTGRRTSPRIPPRTGPSG
jgi:hypothetical protein